MDDKEKIGFDFDGTLTIDIIEIYAKDLVKRGFELWIVTARYDAENSGNKYQNKDLYTLAKKIGIAKEHIIFTNMGHKWRFYKKKNFLFHLDDDWSQVSGINQNTDVPAIRCFGNPGWMGQCEQILNSNQ